MSAHVLIFGDSITEGYWDSQGGWADRLKRQSYQYDLENGKIGDGNSVINLGISADTAERILARIESDSLARKADQGDAIFIVAVGVNDSAAEGKSTDYRFTPDQYRENLLKIIAIIKKWTNDIILVGLTPVDESLTNAIYGDVWQTNERVAMFDAVMREVAQQEGARFVDILKGMSEHNYKSMLTDGLHPNDLGHEWIAGQVKPVLEELLND
jgi:lysophospholipase L1-like esterase